MHWEERFHVTAERQLGLVAKFQLVDIGCDSRHWWQAIRTGRWQPVSNRVLQSAGSPHTDEQRTLAAVLDAAPGAILHWRSTLAWFGLQGFDLAHLHVARARGVSGATSSLAQVHRLRALRAHHVVVVRGVVTETPLRAIWTEAALYAPERRFDGGLDRIGRLLDAAHRDDLVTWGELHEMVHDINQRGRAATVLMRALSELRPPGSSPTESRMETRVEEILAGAGLPPLRRQVKLGGHRPIGRFDFADPDLPLAVEGNSLTFHTTPTDRAADERRYLAMNTSAFMMGILWEADIWSNPRAVAATVTQARRMARAGDHTVLHSPGCPWPDPLLGTRMCC